MGNLGVTTEFARYPQNAKRPGSGPKINLTHGPIPTLGWPGMTMDFAVAPAVDLRTLKPGTRVDFTIEQSNGGNYEIQSVKPAGGGR